MLRIHRAVELEDNIEEVKDDIEEGKGEEKS